MKKLGFYGLGVASCAGLALGWVAYNALHAPTFSLANCSGPSPQPRILFLGDSLTHGTVSDDWVQHLRDDETVSARFTLINGGINSSLVYNVKKRLQDAAACDTVAGIFILAGTNDVNATLSDENRDYYIKKMKLPTTPTHAWFASEYAELIQLAKQKTANITISTLAPIGEDLAAAPNDAVRTYNTTIEQLASDHQINFFDFYAQFEKTLNTFPNRLPHACIPNHYFINAAVFKHYLLGQNWTAVGAGYGMNLITDCLHFNERAGALLVQSATAWLQSIH